MNMTARTSEDPRREWHGLSMPTRAACLARVGRIDFDQDSPSFFRFGVQMGKEGRPRGICNAFGKTMGMHHPIDREVFHTDDAESVDNRTRMLMGEVLSTPCNAFIHTRYHLTMLTPLRRSEGSLRVLARLCRINNLLCCVEHALLACSTQHNKSGERRRRPL